MKACAWFCLVGYFLAAVVRIIGGLTGSAPLRKTPYNATDVLVGCIDVAIVVAAGLWMVGR